MIEKLKLISEGQQMKNRNLLPIKYKTIFLLALTSISIAAKAELYSITVDPVTKVVTRERIDINSNSNDEDKTDKDENTNPSTQEVSPIDQSNTTPVSKNDESNLSVEKIDVIQKKSETKKAEEVEIQAEVQSITTDNPVFKFKQTGNENSKIVYITVKYENQVISNKGYFANSQEMVFTANLSKSYGHYTVEYTEYDNKTIFKKKTRIVRYEIEYKKTASNYRPKVSYAVQSTHPEIVNLSMDVTALAQTEMEKMKAINLWVATNVTYNYSSSSYSQKNDAVTTLDKKTAICMGYANLFAALARAAGLETKVMTGRAISGGKKYYHQWNEVKVDGKWYFVDTTWNASVKSGPETFISLASQYPSTHYKAKEVKAL